MLRLVSYEGALDPNVRRTKSEAWDFLNLNFIRRG